MWSLSSLNILWFSLWRWLGWQLEENGMEWNELCNVNSAGWINMLCAFCYWIVPFLLCVRKLLLFFSFLFIVFFLLFFAFFCFILFCLCLAMYKYLPNIFSAFPSTPFQLSRRKINKYKDMTIIFISPIYFISPLVGGSVEETLRIDKDPSMLMPFTWGIGRYDWTVDFWAFISANVGRWFKWAETVYAFGNLFPSYLIAIIQLCV